MRCPVDRFPQGYGFAFDTDRQTFVLFGGYDEATGKVLNDTWEWSLAAGWVQRHPASPPAARGMTSMVYDPARHVTLMYGGRDTAGGTVTCGELSQWLCSDDTWTWDGTDWKQTPTVGSPPPFVPALAYDYSNQTALVYNFMGNGPGTWRWDGAKWNLVASGAAQHPDPGRSAPVMTFDAATGHVILFGGFSQSGGNVLTMWSWTGHDWRRIGVDSLWRVQGLGAPFAPDLEHHILIGYVNGETWSWDGRGWTQLHPLHQPSTGGQLFADPQHHRIVMASLDFSASSSVDLWAWNGQDWTHLIRREVH